MRMGRYRIGRRWTAMMFAFFAAIILAGVAGAWRLPFLAHTDLEISQHLQRTRSPALDGLMLDATWLGGGVGLWIVALSSAALLYCFGKRRESIAMALSLLSMPLNSLLKLMANRPRPGEGVEVITKTFGSSFPSGHSMGSMAVFGTLAAIAWILTNRWWPSILIATVPIAVGISRIYLGAHWGYDVVAGWSAGALCVAALVAWLRTAMVTEPLDSAPAE